MGAFAHVQSFRRQTLVQIQTLINQSLLPVRVSLSTTILALSSFGVFTPPRDCAIMPRQHSSYPGGVEDATLPDADQSDLSNSTATGKVLIVAGSENDASNNSQGIGELS